MKKNERIFRIIAVTGLGLGVLALLRYESLYLAFREATEELRQVGVDLRFADIADRYDDQGDK